MDPIVVIIGFWILNLRRDMLLLRNHHLAHCTQQKYAVRCCYLSDAMKDYQQ